LVGRHCEVTVIAIEKKHWPAEWMYLIWREEVCRLPQILHSHLDRQDSKTGDNSYRIQPIALQPAESEEAYFYNNFERLTKVTVIGLNRPGFSIQSALFSLLMANYLLGKNSKPSHAAAFSS